MRPSGFSALAVIAMGAAVLTACAQQPGLIGSARPTAAAQQPQTAILRAAPDPKTLLGVPPQTVEQALGRPAFASKDGAAQIWRYTGKACTLLIVFYDEAGTPRSSHLDARHLEGGTAPLEPCLRDVVNAPRA